MARPFSSSCGPLVQRRLCFAALCLVWVNMPSALYAESMKNEPPVLTHDFVVQLPDFASKFAWSPDGRQLAVTQFNTGKVLFVDVERRRLMDRVIEAGDPYIAWSPDGKYVAFNEGSRFINGIRVFSTETWDELGRKARLGGDCPIQNRPSFGFTSDSKSIWASCRQGPFTDRYIVGLKLSLPDLSVADKPERQLSDPIINGHISSDNVVQSESGLLLNSVLTGRSEAQDILGLPLLRHFAAIANLDDKFVPGPVVELDADKDYRRFANDFYQWPERRRLVVFWNWAEHAITKKPVSDKASLPQIETYDLASGKRLAAYGTRSVLRIPLHAIVLARKSGRVIGALSSLAPNEGGLVVWNPDNGEEVQRLETKFAASWLGLSPDEHRLVVVELNELHFYKINQ